MPPYFCCRAENQIPLLSCPEYQKQKGEKGTMKLLQTQVPKNLYLAVGGSDFEQWALGHLCQSAKGHQIQNFTLKCCSLTLDLPWITVNLFYLTSTVQCTVQYMS